MAKYNPIGLYGEGTAIQTHDGYKDGDTIAARHQDIVGYISTKAGNAIRLNTWGTHLGVWVLRAVQPSATKQTETDGFVMCLRGNTVEV